MARIQECSCGAKYNVEKFPTGSKIRCKKCSALLIVEEKLVAPPPPAVPEKPQPIVERTPPPAPVSAPRSRTPEPEVPELEGIPDVPTPQERPRRPSSRRMRAVADQRPRRRDVPPPVEDYEEEPEPEEIVDEMPEEAILFKVDYAEKKRDVLKKAPSFVGLALIVNVIIFAAVIAGGWFVINMMSGKIESETVNAQVNSYEKSALEIQNILSNKLAAAGLLGKVDHETIYKGVQRKYSTASERAVKGTVTIIADIDMFVSGRPNRIEYYGSGFIFKPDGARTVDGYVTTCYENIAGARSVRIMLYDKSIYDARVIGQDVASNIAVLQIDSTQLRANNQVLFDLEFADSDAAMKNVAQTVLSVGSPNGRPNSVALGILSCPDRYTVYTIRTGEAAGFYHQFFQTDAPINWGSTGGPLVDLDGKVVGVCVAGLHTAFRLTDYEGLFFAIHGNYVRKISNIIRKYGKVNRAYTGLMLDAMKSVGATSDIEGIIIAGIEPDSPASKAGLKVGQVIYQIAYTDGNDKVDRTIDCRYRTDLGIMNDIFVSLPINAEITLYVKDIYGADKQKVTFKTAPQSKTVDEVVVAERWGLVVAPLTKSESFAYALPEGVGVKIIAVMENSAAEKAYFFMGNVIIAMDGRQIQNVNSFRSTYQNLDAARKRDITIEIRRNRTGGSIGAKENDFVKMIVQYD